jgi:hypothetical protein
MWLCTTQCVMQTVCQKISVVNSVECCDSMCENTLIITSQHEHDLQVTLFLT